MSEAAAFWVLRSEKAGDNAQVLNLAAATGLAFSTKTLAVLPQYLKGKPRVGASIDHLDLEASDPLLPPWPRIVLAIGRRPSGAALWIKSRSGGSTRIVLIGAPKGGHEDFDLAIAPVHYRNVRAKRVLPVGLPFLALPDAKLEAARLRWQNEFSSLARPLSAILIGGSTGSAEMTANQAARIVRKSLASYPGGTIYAVTSRRTSPAAALSVHKSLPPGSRFHGWSPADNDNPIFGLFALADRFIVSGDSISMAVEAVSTGKPVAIARWRPEDWRSVLRSVTKSIAGRPARDFDLLHDYLFDRGLAVPLGAPFRNPPPLPSDLERAAEAVRKLAASG